MWLNRPNVCSPVYSAIFLCGLFLKYASTGIIPERYGIENDLTRALRTQVKSEAYTWMLYAVFPSDGKLFYRQHLMRPLLEFAVEQINNQSIASEVLQITFASTENLTDCRLMDNLATYRLIEDVSISMLQELYNNRKLVPLAYFGPGCAKSVEDIAKWLNAKGHLPQFDAIAASSTLTNRTLYPTLIRTGYTEARLVEFYGKIEQHFGWSSKAVVYLVDRSDPVWSTILVPLLRRHDTESVHQPYRIVAIESYCTQMSQSQRSYDTLFDDIQYRYTAVYFFAHMDCVKSVLIDAVSKNAMDPPGQVTFIVNNFFDTSYWGTLNLKRQDPILSANDRAALEFAYSQTFIVGYYISERLEEASQELTVEIIDYIKHNPGRYTSPKFLQSVETEGINPTMLGYYSAVHVYAQAMKSVFDEAEPTAINGTDEQERRQLLYTRDNRIAYLIRRTKEFKVPYGDPVRLDGNGDSMGAFSLKYYNTVTGKFCNWMSLSEDDHDLVVRVEHLYEAASEPIPEPVSPGNPPEETTNGPGSFFPGGDGEQTPIEIIAMAAGVALVLIIGGVVMKYYVTKSRYGTKWWMIDPATLKYLKGTDDERAATCVARSYDTQTLKSECGSYAEFLKHEQDGLRIAKYQGQIVAVRHMKRKWTLCTQLLREFRDVRMCSHTNILKFHGICVDAGEYSTVTEFAYRGSMQDLFLGPQVGLEWSLRYSLLHDLAEGMIFIHKSFGFHGNLSSLKCMIDRTFVLKINGYAPCSLQEQMTDLSPWDLLWMAPEILRNSAADIERMAVLERQKADVYSIGIITQELITESVPFPGPPLRNHLIDLIAPAHEIVERVRSSSLSPPYRPLVPPSANSCDGIRELMEQCWSENPDTRPTLVNIKARLRTIRGQIKGSFMDDLMERVQSYAGQLQQAVEERTMQLREEQHKIQSLLYELLPKSVADRLISRNPVEPEPFECVTIYFSDIVSFTTIAAESTAAEVVNMLNKLYQLFDGIIDHYDAYKVETIGDAYMVVSGLPHRNGDNHAVYISKLALNILQAAGNFLIPHRPNDKFKIRIGVHSGACVAGVVGNKMPRYCLFGDTVNTASRMESTSEPNRVQLSGTTAKLIRDNPEFHLESRGIVEVKGKGLMETFWLTPGPVATYYPSPILNKFSYMRKDYDILEPRTSQATLLSDRSSLVSFR